MFAGSRFHFPVQARSASTRTGTPERGTIRTSNIERRTWNSVRARGTDRHATPRYAQTVRTSQGVGSVNLRGVVNARHVGFHVGHDRVEISSFPRVERFNG